MIPAVEDGLESLLRATLPLTPEEGDVSFDTPSPGWSAQVNRLTVNAFLYGVSRSAQPPQPPAVRTTESGGIERRAPQPVVQLSYLVSAWAGSARDAHALLGEVLTRLLAYQVLPEEHLATPPETPVRMSVANDEVNRPREVWQAIGGALRPSFTLVVSVVADTHGWREAATPVGEVVARTQRVVPVPGGAS